MNKIRGLQCCQIANNELIDACDWYERQQAGLGLRFRRDVWDAARQIAWSIGRTL